MLIIFAIKGPSWYKLYHNYRHRLLDQNKDEGEDVVSTDFSERYLKHQTFTFKQGNGQLEEEEDDGDEYFEDPYIKREEVHEGKDNSPEPWWNTHQLQWQEGRNCLTDIENVCHA